MRKETPIRIDDVSFTDMSTARINEIGKNLWKLDFDGRHDFLITKDFAGIAMKLLIFNKRHNDFKGTRRRLSLTLIDATSRVVRASKQIKLSIARGEMFKLAYADFSLGQEEFESGHTYKVVVKDNLAAMILGEYYFHLYGDTEYGDPAEWYRPKKAGLCRPGCTSLYKSVCFDEYFSKDYRIKFVVKENMEGDRPDVLPELEVRLYYPESDKVEVTFLEPHHTCEEYYEHYVEVPFYVNNVYEGVYYAELLCVDTPIAGFAFSTHGIDIEGTVEGRYLNPLDEYCYSAAYDRCSAICNGTDSDDIEAEDFDSLLDAFIASSLTEDVDGEDSVNPDDPEVSECSEEPEATDDMEETDPFDVELPEGDDDEVEQTEEPSLAQELDQLTGLKEVKEKLLVYEKVVNFCSLRRQMNLPAFPTPLHAMFLGSPGTGKTTVAMLMGKMLKKAGLLSRGHVVVRERATLLGQNYNSEAEKTLDAINEAQGGILLIDEAYQLFQKHDPKDPGKFVIETLLTALSDPTKNDWMLILAGYGDEMRCMFEMNPGFKSRIPEANVYTFNDFSMDELMMIAENYLKNLNFSLTDEARGALSRRLASDYAERDRSFGNARHVRNLIETEILPAMAVRVMNEGSSDLESLREITLPDIPQPRASKRQRQAYVGFHCSKAI